MAVDFSHDPNAYATEYANLNNMELEDAKADLKAKYGDPQQQGASTSTGTTGDSIFNNISSMTPDEFAQEYANLNGLTLDEAKNELKTKYGDPVKPEEDNSKTKDSSEESKPDPGMNPNEFINIYAQEHNLSFEKAKEKLIELYGVPVKPA